MLQLCAAFEFSAVSVITFIIEHLMTADNHNISMSSLNKNVTFQTFLDELI